MAKIDAEIIRNRAKAIGQAPMAARPAMCAKSAGENRQLAAQLETQLEWLYTHPDHPRFGEYESAWLTDLLHYEAACDVLAGVAGQQEIAA